MMAFVVSLNRWIKLSYILLANTRRSLVVLYPHVLRASATSTKSHLSCYRYSFSKLAEHGKIVLWIPPARHESLHLWRPRKVRHELQRFALVARRHTGIGTNCISITRIYIFHCQARGIDETLVGQTRVDCMVRETR
jgi:hypothetical protein